MTIFKRRQAGQGMVEYALILALVALIVIVALIATGGQIINLYSNIIQTMCLYHAGCGRPANRLGPTLLPRTLSPPSVESRPNPCGPALPVRTARWSGRRP